MENRLARNARPSGGISAAAFYLPPSNRWSRDSLLFSGAPSTQAFAQPERSNRPYAHTCLSRNSSRVPSGRNPASVLLYPASDRCGHASTRPSRFWHHALQPSRQKQGVDNGCNFHVQPAYVLVGLGDLGYHVTEFPHQMQEAVVVIECSPSADLLETVQRMGVPVIMDDATRPSALETAGVQRAQTIVLCMRNDSLNLQIAAKARSMNPNLRVVIRIFDDDFARSLQEQFSFLALSATGLAAPAFAATAAGADITTPISVDGQLMSVARMTLAAASRLNGKSVQEVEDAYHIN